MKKTAVFMDHATLSACVRNRGLEVDYYRLKNYLAQEYETVHYGDDWLVLVDQEKKAVRGFYAAADILSDLRIEIAEGKS